MTNPPVKATEALEKLPAAKPLRSGWLTDYDPKPRIDTSLNRLFDTRTDTAQKRLLDWPLHMLAIYPSRKDRLCLY